MPQHSLFEIFFSPLNQLEVRYMVTGAVASIIYGEPRLTHDMDLVIDLHPYQIEKFVSAFPLEEFYCPPEEVIRLEAGRRQRGHFNLIHHATGFKADVYLAGEDNLHHWAMNNRKQVNYEGQRVWLAPVEYVIVRKLEYYREGESEKHLQDISGILMLSSNQIDFEILLDKIHEYSLEREWEKAQRLKDRRQVAE